MSGNYATTGGATLNTTNGTSTGVSPLADPYADVQIPSYSGCNKSSYALSTGSDSISASGGVYVFCNGLTMSGGTSLTLGPGTYIVDRGSFNISGSSTISGTGVTIVLTSSTGTGYATASVSGGS